LQITTRGGYKYKWTTPPGQNLHSAAFHFQKLEQLVLALDDIKSKGRGTKAVVNMSWGHNAAGAGSHLNTMRKC
jgi:hypothetical protein